MSISSSDQSNRAAARAGEPRNGRPAAAFELFPGESDKRLRAVPDLRQEPLDDREWEHVAREARHQQAIEASFDRAEAYARLCNFKEALEWLDRAATLSGGLPPAYRARRARWALSTAVRLRATDGHQDAGSAGRRAHR